MIACVFIPDFAVVIARTYHGISPDWPLILARYTKHRGKVFAISPEVKRHGVTLGMAAHKAMALYPQARLVEMVESPQERTGDNLLEALSGFSDRLELEHNHTGTIWIDLGNLPDTDALDIAYQIRDTVIDQSLFLPALGVANGKFSARIAAVMAGEGGIKLVPTGDEQTLLAPLPVKRLALSKKQLEQFKFLGIETLGQLAILPVDAAHIQFGAVGKRLHALARGIDPSPVAAYTPQLKHYREHQFEPAVAETSILESVLEQLAAELASFLAAKGLATQAIMLTLQLDNKHVLEERFTPREPIASQISIYTHFARLLNSLSHYNSGYRADSGSRKPCAARCQATGLVWSVFC